MNRRRRIGASMAAFVAFIVGLGTMLSLLLGDNPALFGGGAQGSELAEFFAMPGEVLLRLLAIFLAMSIAIGIVNLLAVHSMRALRGGLMSGVLIVSFAGTIAWHSTQRGDTSLLENVQLPIESSLAALLCVTLVAGGARVLSKRSDIWGLLFVAVVLVVLLDSMPLPEVAPVSALSDWLMRIPVQAGARAILLGIALGSVVTGVRALLGQDRAYWG